MIKYYGVLFNRKTGKVIKTIEGVSKALLEMYALQNGVSATRDYLVFNSETGEITFYCEGRKNDFPKICKDMEGIHIEKICADWKQILT